MRRFSAALVCSSSAGVGRGIATAVGTGADGPITTGAKLPRPPPGAPPGGAPAGACADAAPEKGTMAKRSIRTISRLVMGGILSHEGHEDRRIVFSLLMADKVQFGPFTFDIESGTLCKHGSAVRLQPQPARVLAALLRRPGAVVSREELRQELWPTGTYVDFERGLNFAVAHIRSALGDSASRAV